ncbi:UDP-N-acetylmuramate dehydrogenase [Patescibacteria group bacterium]|nr:UDP-N-acetylmuramate dehydrogenase [Patescibacteria group bacterium]
MMNSKYKEIIEILGKERVGLNELMSNHTTFKIGGPADLFFEARTQEELKLARENARKLDIPHFLLGGGSNILFADKGYRGLIIKLKIEDFTVEGEKITAGSGLLLSKLVNLAMENSLSGLEFAVDIPGTVGGAVVDNAGAWQQSMGDLVQKVAVLDENGIAGNIDKIDCSFEYRRSCFKGKNTVVLFAELLLKKGNKNEIEKRMEEYLEKRSNQPKEPSAGCVFVNPKPVSAGELIEKCGLKETRIGDAQISGKHANFVVNLGNAKSSDVLKLVLLMKQKVKEKFGIDLIEEIVKIGEF